VEWLVVLSGFWIFRDTLVLRRSKITIGKI
jgi:hypothetical protein